MALCLLFVFFWLERTQLLEQGLGFLTLIWTTVLKVHIIPFIHPFFAFLILWIAFEPVHVPFCTPRHIFFPFTDRIASHVRNIISKLVKSPF